MQTAVCEKDCGLQGIAVIKEARRLKDSDSWLVRGWLGCGHHFGIVMTARNYTLAKLDARGAA